ncbi:uncharacterized protein STEHIDRAFT_122727 [Stereum hirsutum FP-91666 SS1]|uniref:uncharacterized protein n=1 Tax=Stereum hirsutum (strain FP-91666) TaxID=721885 RepID=UPI0004449F91|nr:uncharacterized protein STEHIDRAFT_122727 [Stereum hirsutum FP-91666 SS1]EIM84752.1 hypothetical protein STEHIDRAFT_122727 [Stereum hirsutum FP-91666 SS1]
MSSAPTTPHSLSATLTPFDPASSRVMSTVASSPPDTSIAGDDDQSKDDEEDEEKQGDDGDHANDADYEVPVDDDVMTTKTKTIADEDPTARLRRLDYLLQKSSAYSQMLSTQMEAVRANAALQAQAQSSQSKPVAKAVGKKTNAKVKKGPRKSTRGKGRGKRALETDDSDSDSAEVTSSKRAKVEEDGARDEEEKDKEKAAAAFVQPELLSGATLKDYQLEGVAWMWSLFDQGISGILADEMGLGKTIQTIAFLAHLRGRVGGLSLVVCPLSVLHNWVEEFTKFAPEIPICMYHGTPDERAELRRTVMPLNEENMASKPEPAAPQHSRHGHGHGDDDEYEHGHGQGKSGRGRGARGRGRPRGRGRGRGGRATDATSTRKSARSSTRTKGMDVDEEEDTKPSTSTSATKSGKSAQPTLRDYFGAKPSASKTKAQTTDTSKDDDSDSEPAEDKVKTEVKAEAKEEADPFPLPHQVTSFPVVITTYEMIIKDRIHLSKYKWGQVIVDEGHRLKNMDCRLMQEVKRYESAWRMVLSGTPLQNNLAELWSLLNFILPDIFNDLDSFQEWFNLPTLSSTISTSQSTQLLSTLHNILKPFLLRRLKVDVEKSLPPKKEYVLYAPLSERQREVYDAIVKGGLRGMLVGRQHLADDATQGGEEKEAVDEGRKLRKKQKRKYDVDGSDKKYFQSLERGEVQLRPGEGSAHRRDEGKTVEELGRKAVYDAKLKKINNLHLQNAVMQLRKVCSHPFLFDWPLDERTNQLVINHELVNASGKMMVLERLLDELFERGHKVLVFSQFVTMLDVIEDWATEFKGWPLCRIDGSTNALDRRAEMNRFQTGGDKPDAPRLFLLSTRAGGLGITLTAADTVIFYDQDWNPQMDLQAQDRAHRIGQTRPVLVFRLVSKHTIESKIMERASEKRQLEAMVIAKGKFKMPVGPASAAAEKRETMAEMAASLLALEGEKIEVVPDTEAGKKSIMSDADLDALLDRRKEVFEGRGAGWTSATAGAEKAGKGGKGGKKAKDEDGKDGEGDRKGLFEVYEAPKDEGNEALARMMAEDEPAEF